MFVPAKFESFEIVYDGKWYKATVFYTVNGRISHINSGTQWSSIEDAKKWVEEISGIKVK